MSRIETSQTAGFRERNERGETLACYSLSLCVFFRSKALEEQREQERRLGEVLKRGRLRMTEVNEELGAVVKELQNARMDSHENRRQQKRDEVLESLRRLYPDVVVLYRPHQERPV